MFDDMESQRKIFDELQMIEDGLDTRLDGYRLMGVMMLRDACDRWLRRHGYED
jgi:hypothetical protein